MKEKERINERNEEKNREKKRKQTAEGRKKRSEREERI